MSDLVQKPAGYGELLAELKMRIRTARVRAGVAVNRELVLLYWSIGRDILGRQRAQGWGSKVIERLSQDLRSAFPDQRGLSPRNLLFMRGLAEAWPDEEIVKQVVSQIPWGHNVRLLQKVKNTDERLWYAKAAFEHGWSRNILEMQIDSGLYGRQGKAVTNFSRTLPAAESDLAQQTVKDPYNFDFLMLGDEAQEREVEQGLIAHLQNFLVELGVGFAFVGRQVRLEVGGDEFFVDLLFYHLKLRCYVVIELKGGEFKPEYAGKLNFYLTAVNELLSHPDDQPPIGLLLCRARNRLVAEWALRGVERPIGVSEYQLTESLPENLLGQLPTVEDLEQELGNLPGPEVIDPDGGE